MEYLANTLERHFLPSFNCHDRSSGNYCVRDDFGPGRAIVSSLPRLTEMWTEAIDESLIRAAFPEASQTKTGSNCCDSGRTRTVSLCQFEQHLLNTSHWHRPQLQRAARRSFEWGHALRTANAKWANCL